MLGRAKGDGVSLEVRAPGLDDVEGVCILLVERVARYAM
jgi:hypothetical protein